jgi:hypothetical protein
MMSESILSAPTGAGPQQMMSWYNLLRIEVITNHSFAMVLPSKSELSQSATCRALDLLPVTETSPAS